MSRPITKRKIGFFPENYGFTPENANKDSIEEIVLTHVELECIRLSDYENLEQVEAADRLGISRGTYQRILNSARKKVSDALVFGKKISISGGNYYLSDCHAICQNCGYSWKAPCNKLFYSDNGKCPDCGSDRLSCSGAEGKCSLGERRHIEMMNPKRRQKYRE